MSLLSANSHVIRLWTEGLDDTKRQAIIELFDTLEKSRDYWQNIAIAPEESPKDSEELLK